MDEDICLRDMACRLFLALYNHIIGKLSKNGAGLNLVRVPK